jgi:hypothetical protein
MAIGGITQTASTQANLNALATSSKLLDKSERHVSTGKAVNGASDNAVAFFTAQNFLQQANNLSTVKDNLATSLTTIDATTDALSSVTKVVKQLHGLTTQALSTTDTAARAGLASQYNALLPQLDQLVNDATFNGTNLLNGTSNSLSVNFNATNTSGLTVKGVNATSTGLNLTPATNGFATVTDINAATTQLQNGLSSLNTSAENFGANATLIQTNQDFTSNLINNNTKASADLTTADINEEAANLLALKVQNDLGTTSLGISGKQAQSFLSFLQ